MSPRDEIEQIIKEHCIDKTQFSEISKTTYRSIKNRVVSKFINVDVAFDFNLHRGYLRYNPKMRCIGIEPYDKHDWWQWFKLISKIVNEADPVYIFFIGDTGDDHTWAYVGYIAELEKILYYGSPIGNGDCYVVSKKLEWLMGYSDDADYVTCVDNEDFFSFENIQSINPDLTVTIRQDQN